MAQREKLVELKESLVVSRLPMFKTIYMHFVWSSKRTNVSCEIYGKHIQDDCNYHLGTAWAHVGHLESKPGRNIERLCEVAKLRTWMRTLEYIPKRRFYIDKQYNLGKESS